MTRRQALERRAYWQGVMRQQESSGLSISAFCREHTVAAGSFFYWRRKLTMEQSQEGAAGKDKGTRPSSADNNSVAKFVPVEIPATTETIRARCELVLPDGCRLIVPTQCDAGWLREILGTLREQAC